MCAINDQIQPAGSGPRRVRVECPCFRVWFQLFIGCLCFSDVPTLTGEVDLEMFSELRLKHLAVTVDNQVVEPIAQQLHLYKGMVRVTIRVK